MEARTRAYNKARNYMRRLNKPCNWNLMSNKDKILFTYIRSTNEIMFNK